MFHRINSWILTNISNIDEYIINSSIGAFGYRVNHDQHPGMAKICGPFWGLLTMFDPSRNRKTNIDEKSYNS